MAAQVCARPAPVPHQPASSTSSQLSINTSQAGSPKAVPHKHIPYCSPGPRPTAHQLDTPPASPPSSSPLVETTSLLYPPSGFDKITDEPPIYSISAEKLSQAIDHLATQPLPAAEQVFPWLHGLHPENQLQLAFFTARKKSLRRTPKCLRGLTIVKAGGDLSHSRLKGAIAPDEILCPVKPGRDRKSEEGEFLDVDPKEGFSVRNFHIQTCKMATVSDLVVYRDYQTPQEEAERLARRLARAQTAWQRKTDGSAFGGSMFNTFIVSDEYLKIEAVYPDLVALDADGCMAASTIDFFHAERVEMCSMTAASEISHNVWLGPTPDPSVDLQSSALPSSSAATRPNEPPSFDIMVEASDMAQIPEPKAFRLLDDLLQRKANAELAENAIPQLEFPGSGAILPPTWSQAEVDGLLATCEWIYRQAHTPPSSSSSSPVSKRRDSKLSLGDGSVASADTDTDIDEDGDIPMSSSSSSSSPTTTTPKGPEGHRILLHCTDGYTESSLLALAYYMFAEQVPAHTAWIRLHRERGRNFFAYATDVALLRAIQPRLLQASPKYSVAAGGEGGVGGAGGEVGGGAGLADTLCPPTPEWLEKMDGSLPSRILDHLYLGNLGHANNVDLLRELGVGQVLSVGEPVGWGGCEDHEEEEDGGEGVKGVGEGVEGDDEEGGKRKKRSIEWMFVDQTQDNGVDPLMGQFGRCLEFIEQGRRAGTSTLVHCRVGVSRSATICIAHVMQTLNLSFPRAYCFVRARRLNVIIQPHLRFVWELMKWEEVLQERQGGWGQRQGGVEGESQQQQQEMVVGGMGKVKREMDWASVCCEIAAMNRPYSRQ
ncbi:tyrosine protein phosphatase 1 [Hortaea werneckii]|nr:tyrosine protein phosphatase 1 [Hortaea werneckii]